MAKTTPIANDRDIYTISRLNQEARLLLESHFPPLWISGEISNFVRPASGHWYLTLKDNQSQVRCAMFRGRNSAVNFIPENGMQVLVYAKLSLYEGRGDFQLLIERMEPAGDGLLRQQFEALKQKLSAAGYFAAEHKKSLPKFPKQLGVITSPTGAAIRDILSVLRRRFPQLPIIIYPTLVQGKQAAAQIANTIALANARKECDVLILARGGGSLEDLFAFNEEIVAEAIFNSETPIISGIGHEIDFTIADFVADVRAPTPSVAAEHCTPRADEVKESILTLQSRLHNALEKRVDLLRHHLHHLKKRLVHPGERILQWFQHCDQLEARLLFAFRHLHSQKQNQLSLLTSHLAQTSPKQLISQHVERVQQLRQRLLLNTNALIKQKHQLLQSHMRALDAISPLATLDRGFAIIRDENERIITRSSQVNVDQTIKTQLKDGVVYSVVSKVN